MPNLNTFKISGSKIVPVNRFNLEEGKLSTNFSNVKEDKTPQFSVVAHPILSSVVLQPAIINAIFYKEYFPLIEDVNSISQNSLFKDFNENAIQLQFPDIDIAPLNNSQIFYYENVLNDKSESIGFLGKVTLNYTIKNKAVSANLQNIPVQLKEVILNLKVKDNVIKINGVVDDLKKEIIFHIKDEAVKIAFSNLVTNIDELKSSIDLFFSFKGYSKVRKNFFLARDLVFQKADLISSLKYDSMVSPVKLGINRPLIIDDRIDIVKPLKPISDEEEVKLDYVKSTFILKVNKTINYPLQSDPLKSLYQTIGGGFVTNPFKFNEDFSLYEQIFIPGINLDKLSIYKSKVTANEFLLISKRYYISRSSDTKAPCINTIFHGTESDSGLSNDISKISFQFAIGPDLSEFDLNKIKIDLFNNNFLDGDTSKYFDKVKFIYPNEIEADFEINGNQYLQNANITTDGKYFLVDFTTESLNDASILINSINNSLSQYANINFKHKEIKDTSIIELNIQKTIGEILLTNIDNTLKKINFKNESLSSCKMKSILFVDEVDKPQFSSALFSNYLLDSEQTKEINYSNIQASLANKNLNKVFFDFESIENISKEFSNIVATSSNFNKYVQIQFQTQKASTSRIQLELFINATSAIFNLERLKADFKTPLLINFLLNNNIISDTRIKYKANYFDKDNNLVTTHEDNFDYSTSTIFIIPKK